MSRLEELLQQCTVKISLPEYGWGTGFFVAPGWILTCAHVVQNLEEQAIQVRWQNQENWAEAVVERSFPNPYDLALLRVTLPTDANPPCVLLGEEVRSRDPLYLFGYPDQDFPNGCPVTFDCEGVTGDTPPLIKFALGQVRPGMSGAPLLNQRTGEVCGIVNFTRDRSFDLGGGAVSATAILEKFPELKQRSFHQQDSRWRTLLAEMSNNGLTDDSLQVKETVKKVLVLSANPKKRANKRKTEEIKKIRDALARTQRKDQFEVQDRCDITADTLSQEIWNIKPYIINIFGCEDGVESLFLESRASELAVTGSEKLIAALFKHHAKPTECVIFNGCYSEVQAKEIAQHIKFVIGITQDLGNKQVLAFLNEFYFFLGSGETVKYSYEASRNLLQRQQVNDALLPILLSRDVEIRRRKLEEKLSSCNKEIEKNSNRVELWKERASLLRELERFEEADKAYEIASSLDPDNYEIRTEQGDALGQFGEHEKAVVAYDKALELKEDYKVLWKRGQALVEVGRYHTGQYGQAIESYRKAVELNPPPPDKYVIYREYGSLLESLGQYQNGIELYNLALRSEPKYRATAYLKKQAYRRMYFGIAQTLF